MIDKEAVLLVEWFGAALIAGLISFRTTVHLASLSPLRGRNYRGLLIPTAAGIAPILGFLGGLGFIALWTVFVDAQSRVRISAALSPSFLAVALGFGLLGLWDDLAADQERGWRAHLLALRHGRATPGAIKLAGGTVLAFTVVTAFGAGFWWRICGAAVVAMTANLFNLLDKRPGRCIKSAFVAGLLILILVPLLTVRSALTPAVAASMGALFAFLPFDLRERVMLGDTGANAIGAIIGLAIALAASHTVLLVLLVILIVLHVVGERPGLSHLIAATSPLRKLDAVGRVSE